MAQKNYNKNTSRKEAIKKMGSYAAFAALGTMVMLNPQNPRHNLDPLTIVVGFLTVVVLGAQEEIKIKIRF